jgi:hypothetical protein
VRPVCLAARFRAGRFLGCRFLAVLAAILLGTMALAQSVSLSKSAVESGLSRPDPAGHAQAVENYGKLPLSFEANHGQTDGQVKFVSRTNGYTLFLTGDEAVLALRGSRGGKAAPKGATGSGESSVSLKRYPDTNQRPKQSSPALASPELVKAGVLRMKLRNANPAAQVTGVEEQAGRTNYFLGNDPKKWRTNVPTYAKVKYEGIYSGIDLVYYGNQRQLEYDFIVAPGADPSRITFDISGTKRVRRDVHGELVFTVGDDEIRWHQPVVYQEKDGTRQPVAARYAVTGKDRVRFELAKYDKSRPLYIDPLIYSTYLGGSGDDDGDGIAVDSTGSAYITGQTASTNFPTTNALQVTGGGSYDAFVTKLNPAGSAMVYSTYLGGSSVDYGYGIAVDSAGDAYVVGNTGSADFPTVNPLQAANAGGLDVFVSVLNPTGSALIYSTYLGGSGDDTGSAIALDSSNDVYITGSTFSANFPTYNPIQATYAGNGTTTNAFVAEINSAGSALVYSTYLGGSGPDVGNGIAVDTAGNAYVAGQTVSPNFPTMNPFQATDQGLSSAFVSKISSGGTGLAYSTYLGGSGYDFGYAIAVDGAGDAYVTGSAGSTNFPTMNALQPVFGGGAFDAFITEFNPAGSGLVYSTYLGGKLEDDGYGISVDSAGNVYLTGYTLSTNFPLQNAYQKRLAGDGDAFVSKVSANGSALTYSSYLGGSGDDSGAGIAVDGSGYAYVTGNTGSTNFPTANPVQAAYGGGPNDAFVTKIDVRAATTTTLASSPNPSGYGQAVSLTATVSSLIGAPPNGEGISFMKGTTVLGTGVLSGGSASLSISTLAVGSDSVTAVYGGDSNLSGSTSKAVTQTVNQATTTTALTSSLNPANYGQSVTFTATVTPQYSGTATGVVSFYDGMTLLKGVTMSGGSAAYTTSKLTGGMHNITATYDGSTSFSGSTASLTETIIQMAATTTTLSTSPNPSAYGQAVTLTATVTSSNGPPPDGESVTFKKGTTVLGTGTLSGGSASISISTLAVGNNSITAVYGGDSNFTGSTSKAVTQVVNKATTTTTLTSSLNPSNFGQSVTFTASVTPQFSGTVTGVVSFYDGATLLKGVTLSGGSAAYTTTKLAVGMHNITATYNGSTAFSGSTGALTQTVN